MILKRRDLGTYLGLYVFLISTRELVVKVLYCEQWVDKQHPRAGEFHDLSDSFFHVRSKAVNRAFSASRDRKSVV